MREAVPTPFRFEALSRHAIRSGLCLNGWSWARADAYAADIAESALRQIGAKRPSWKLGQPEFTQEGHSPIERTRCVTCHRRLEGEHTRFCDTLCLQAWHKRHERIRDAEDAAVAYDLVAKGRTWWPKA